MPNISTDGDPIPLTLVPLQAFNAMAEAAQKGFVELPDQRKVTGAEYLQSLVAAPESVSAGEVVGAYAAGNTAALVGSAILLAVPVVNVFAGAILIGTAATRGAVPLAFASKIGVALVIANGLKGALRQSDSLFVHGVQTGYPALVDTNGVEPPQNRCSVDGYTELQGMDTPLELYGIGCYRFEKDRSAAGMGVFGTSGAVAFTSDDPASNGKTMAISWHLPERLESGKPACGVTADLTGSYKSLQAFYDATAGNKSAAQHEAHTSDWHIDASLVPRSADHQKMSSEYVLTVSVQQGQAA